MHQNKSLEIPKISGLFSWRKADMADNGGYGGYMAAIPSKCSKSGMQGNRGQGFVLSVLILRVQRKQRTKNFSFDVAMRRFKKKSGRCRAAGCESIMEQSLFAAFSLLRASNNRGPGVRFFL